ncbi:hypothetical protein M413DRAFT_447332 [Hebeloma cylindrosporum]|uniref:Wax synthase domain-containing protein n=1 Tax=Hebeloma cylindrosporum TaxID=76867 RepID=A0A0C2XMP5_HEBCY|nr:hypothetical protein M413DRAFT_447332 [Hebeloma cylindrosporum h7]
MVRGKHDLNRNLFGLCQLILFIALVHGGGPNARFNWIFFIPIFIIYIYSVFFCASDSAPSDFSIVTSFMGLIPTASDYILLRDRQPELQQIGQKKPTSEMTFTERLTWAASLLATSRGIGWKHEPTAHIPPRPTTSRGEFIASQFLWLIFYYILLDIALSHVQENPCFRIGGPSLAAFGWLWRMTSLVYIVVVYCTMSGVYAAVSIVTVAIGLYEPRDWPHLFGSLCDAYTLRKCWGRVWHQTLRRMLTSNSNFIAAVLHPPKGTFTTYFKLFTSFLISGLMHASGDYILHQNFSQGTSVQFFLLQAVGITFEDAVIALASRLGYKQSRIFKLIGFIWVFAWFTFCMPLWLDPQVHAGTIGGMDRVSVVQLLLNARFSAKWSDVANSPLFFGHSTY